MDTLSHLDNRGERVVGSDGKPLPDDSTNPIDKNSHPPYHTKLQVDPRRLLPIPADVQGIQPRQKPEERLLPGEYDRSGKPTVYAGRDEKIQGTKFKIKSFKFKEVPGPDNTTKTYPNLRSATLPPAPMSSAIGKDR